MNNKIICIEFQKITKKEWKETPKDYKTFINYIPYILQWGGGNKGTVLTPVEIINNPKNRG
ncbi:MAG: hypothetical protein ACYCSQ_06615 [bacterium]|jgi:hypothetical protein|nr:hypothetical protein [Deltaproteobacteria bacterium]